MDQVTREYTEDCSTVRNDVGLGGAGYCLEGWQHSPRVVGMSP